MRYQLTLRFETPFSVGIGNEALFHTTTQRVIPGATLRGALAALWWRGCDSADDFAALFDDDLLVTQAVPEGAVLRTTSTVACKYGAEPRCGEAVYDCALFVASGEALDIRVCPRCKGPLTAKPGWIDLPDPVRRGRVQLRADETAEDGRLYSRDYVGKGTRYIAEIETSADLSWLHDATVRIGQGRSQDRGRALATVAPLEEKPLTWHDRPVAIHLTSPAIITNQWGAPSLDLDDVERELQRVSGDENLTLNRRPEWVRSELVTGWHGRSNLPKVPDWAFAPGTSFVVDGLTADGWRRLRRGIGWRRIDGYGQLALTGWEPTNRPPFEVTAEWWDQESAELRKHKRWSDVKGTLCVACINLSDTSEVSEEKTQRNLDLVLAKAPPQFHDKLRELLALEPRQLGQLAELLRSGSKKKSRNKKGRRK
ncbi:hypothetical protein J5A61_01015 [Arachnia propionica]|uniref:hypothetical protein n=1 Tax=Arachnia propionica TaxID=1750 RepID=UPI001BA6B0D4|nr:hypothetical protein [Arachnia propionica]QUC14365.1 hypothetical protein J5A61_01015 [Arachnia propionica]